MKNVIWVVGGLIVIIAVIFLISSKREVENDTMIPSPISEPANSMTDESTSSAENLPFTLLASDNINGKKIRISTEKGDVVVELYGDSPLASSNFIHLAEKEFYNGLTFHRREEGFVIQGGDPDGDGTGGPGYSFADEPVSRSYNRGIVAMANSGPNTNGSQFFIMLKDAPQLPKQYTIFGNVIKGLDVVDKIKVGDKMLKLTIELL